MQLVRHLRGASLVVLALFVSASCDALPPKVGAAAASGALSVVDRGATLGGDALRSGWYPDQTDLDPLTVSSPYFGRLFDATVEGQIYAQPLVAGGVVLVATEANRVYGLDPVTGAALWTHDLGTPWNAADLSCGDLLPTIGVTGTPAVDETTGTAYLLSKTYRSGAAIWFAHSIDLVTGAERAGFPIEIKGAAANEPTRVFDPQRQMQRPGLLLMNGVVYVAFGAHCDRRPYAGWVIGISTGGAITTLWTTEAGPVATDGAGIWQAGGGLVSDGDGQILFATGNDWSYATVGVPGRTPPGALGESIVRLAVQPDGTLAAKDFFSPGEAPTLNWDDSDLGSGAPVGLPVGFGTPTHPNLLVHAGKSGYLYLLDRDDLGGYRQGPNGSDQILQRLGPAGAVWSKPSAWPGDGGWVYLPVANGCAGPSDPTGCLHAYQRGVAGDGTPVLAPAVASTSFFGYGTSAVVVTSDGTRSGSALLWTVWTENYYNGWNGTAAQLRAYDAVPENGTLKLRYLSGIGTSAKFTPPAVGDGRVYVGTRDGHVIGFGLTGAPPLRAAGTAFAPALVGDTLVATVTLTISARVTIAALATSGDFTLTADAPAAPFAAAAGDLVEIPIAVRPSIEGPVVGTLQVTTDGGTFTIPLTGVGRSATPLLVASPSTLIFPPTAAGKVASRTITITNVSNQTVPVTGFGTPTAPFSVTGLPTVGSALLEGASFTVTVNFAPTSVGSSSAYFSAQGVIALAVTAIEGTALSGGLLRIEPAALELGAIPVGTEAKATFSLINDGDLSVTIGKSKPPALGLFQADGALPEGAVIEPGARLQQEVRVTPLVAGLASDTWELNADDGQGVRQITMAVTGLAAAEDPPLPSEIAPREAAPHGCAAAGGTPSANAFAALALLAIISRARRRT